MNWSAPLQRAHREIKMDILFAIFGAQNKKILILQIKSACYGDPHAQFHAGGPHCA
jgi:hypothetical protein